MNPHMPSGIAAHSTLLWPNRASLALLALVVAAISCSTFSQPSSDTEALAGRWHEIAWVDCETGEAIPPGHPIRELRFNRDGTLTVTWDPIETYVDYKARYETPDAGAMKITITWSAYAPGDFDGTGTYQIAQDGTLLLLQDLWLGSPKGTQGLNGCGHVFERVD